jgi:hypothetical protein
LRGLVQVEIWCIEKHPRVPGTVLGKLSVRFGGLAGL